MAQENSILIRRWFEEIWNSGRMEAIDEMASPDVIGHGQAQHATDIGLKEFKVFAASFRTAFPDMKVTIDFIIEQGDKVVARWTATMTHKGEFLGIAPTGKKATITGTSTQRVRAVRSSRVGTTGISWVCWCRSEPFRRRILSRRWNRARPSDLVPQMRGKVCYAYRAFHGRDPSTPPELRDAKFWLRSG
jgi:predicted ester cyclase